METSSINLPYDSTTNRHDEDEDEDDEVAKCDREPLMGSLGRIIGNEALALMYDEQNHSGEAYFSYERSLIPRKRRARYSGNGGH